MTKLSLVVNTLNEEKGLENLVASVKGLVDEIVVCDMKSDDGTAELARKLGAKVFSHERLSYVEPARNFAISKATGDWILVLDADEEIGSGLKSFIKKTIQKPNADYYRLPRKNIIFGKWITHSRWWPDYNIRLFRKGSVSWNEVIHSVPMTSGKGHDFEAKEELAIIHNSYRDIDHYLEHLTRYSKAQADSLLKDNYKFHFSDLISKPTNEFLSRYFAGEGYKDGVHGLTLSLLQAFSELVVYIRLWNYREIEIDKKEVVKVMGSNMRDLKWWIRKEFSWLKNLKFR